MKVGGSFVHLTTLPKSEKSECQGVMFLELWNFLRPLGRRPQAPVGNIVGKTVYLCANLMVETGHFVAPDRNSQTVHLVVRRRKWGAQNEVPRTAMGRCAVTTKMPQERFLAPPACLSGCLCARVLVARTALPPHSPPLSKGEAVPIFGSGPSPDVQAEVERRTAACEPATRPSVFR